MTAPAELVVRHARLATCAGDGGLGMVDDGALVCGGGRLLWVGEDAALGAAGVDASAAEEIDAGGRLVTPGLVDCHAHPIFAGNRAAEFAVRAAAGEAGASYQAIAAAGGGIRATVAATRAASFEALVELTVTRAARARAWGTTTLEAKSGYDLTEAGELRMLEVAREVEARGVVRVSPTLLGAHSLPAEYGEDRAGYVAACVRMAEAAGARGLATAIDVYCDDGAFTLAETRAVLAAGKRAGLAVRAHVGQFADLGAAELVAELGGRSCDHLEQVSEAGMAAMAAADVVAVMLPGACVQLRMAPPPVAKLRAAGVKLAVATDVNPGTSFSEALPLQMWLATTHYGMTVEEAWLGVTRVAAQVLGRDDVGRLAPGAWADFVLWDAEVPAEVPYHYGANLVERVFVGGRSVID